jgi:glycosyltransferase involved in cell wall biosynthesis
MESFEMGKKKLTILFDHRFYRDPSGRIGSQQNYGYAYFKDRYLSVFDRVVIVARVAAQATHHAEKDVVTGPGVELVSLGNWQGLMSLVRRAPEVVRVVVQQTARGTGFLLIVPGVVCTIGHCILQARGARYHVDVSGNPIEAFSPRADTRQMARVYALLGYYLLRFQVFFAWSASYVTKSYLQALYPVRSGRSFSASKVELPDHACLSKRSGASGDCFSHDRPMKLCMIASMEMHYKGHDAAVEVLRLCRAMGRMVVLEFVGDGRLRASIHALVVRYGLGDMVKFHGRISSGSAVWSILDRCDLLLHPSRTEGLPRVVIEAMARRLPCVATNVGGTSELLDKPWLVDVDDIDAMVRKVCHVYDNYDRIASEAGEENASRAHDYTRGVLMPRREAFARSMAQNAN